MKYQKLIYLSIFFVIILCIYFLTNKKDRKNVNKLDNTYLHIVICATHDNDDYRVLTNSLEKNGYKYSTICWGKEWKGSGYGMRMQDTLDYINKSASNGSYNGSYNGYYDDDLILYLDGYDVMVVGELEELVNKFNKFNKDIVFAAEKSLWPDISIEWAKLIPQPHQSNPYLNAQFLGKAKEVKKMLEQAHKHLSADDQGEFTHYFLNHQDTCELDYECEIFQCLNKTNVERDFVINERIVNKEFNTKPIIIHGNSTDGKYKLKNIESNLK